MTSAPMLFSAKVMHKRHVPTVNAFTYNVFYLAFPYRERQALADGWRFGVDRAGLMSFSTSSLINPEHLIEEWGLMPEDGELMVVTMPRVLGYEFNPVSFWLTLNKDKQLCAVIAEVHNTFGERHNYICAHADRRPIRASDVITAQKLFHVSPFMPRQGRYKFRFDLNLEDNKLGIWIDYEQPDGRLDLSTSLLGHLQPYTRENRQRFFWQIPWLSLKVMGLIHWQALKLWLGHRIPYIPKPIQLACQTTEAESLVRSEPVTERRDGV